MARVKMHAHRALTACTWLGVLVVTLIVAYGISAATAHLGTYITWR